MLSEKAIKLVGFRSSVTKNKQANVKLNMVSVYTVQDSLCTMSWIQLLDFQQGKTKKKDIAISGSDLATGESKAEQEASVLSRILKEFQKVSAHLDTVESQVA